MPDSHLTPERRIDFSNSHNLAWLGRRSFIGLLLFVYYLYAIIFAFSIADPSILAASGSTNKYEGASIQNIFALITKKHLLLMMTFGFLGSVFSITKVFLQTGREDDCSVAWYVTRPAQGVLMAIFIYYAFRAGQLVFYSADGNANEKDINVYTLSLLAILAGMFSDNAYERLYSIANTMIRQKKQSKSNS